MFGGIKPQFWMESRGWTERWEGVQKHVIQVWNSPRCNLKSTCFVTWKKWKVLCINTNLCQLSWISWMLSPLSKLGVRRKWHDFLGVRTQSFINQGQPSSTAHITGPPMMLKKTAQKALSASLNHLALNQRIGKWEDFWETPIFQANILFHLICFHKSVHGLSNKLKRTW